MKLLRNIFDGIMHILYPNYCLGCGKEEAREGGLLCVSCLYHLPYTNHFEQQNNDFEKHFIGRVPIVHGGALLIYSDVVENLIHHFKYEAMTKIGQKYGRQIGKKIIDSKVFEECGLYRSRTAPSK